jgi:hypothetical protein
MPSQSNGRARKVRTLRARRIRGKTYADECRALQESIGRDRKGELMPDSTEVIRAMREGALR